MRRGGSSLVVLLLLGALGGCSATATGPQAQDGSTQIPLCGALGAPAAAPGAEPGALCLDRDTGPAPLIVHVLEHSTAALTVRPVWDLPDPVGSAAHVYVQPGVYTVQLAIPDASGHPRPATRRVTVLPPEVSLAGPTLCRLGQTAQLMVGRPLPHPLSWQAAQGEVCGDAVAAVYRPPVHPGADRVRATYDVQGTPFTLTHAIQVFRQLVILKADDLGGPSARWQRYLDYLAHARIPSAIGTIGEQLKDAPHPWVGYLLGLQATGLFEFFHHGWDHGAGNHLEGANAPTPLYEFQGTSYAYQRAHLDRTLRLADDLGFVVRTFGAPYNRTDGTTVQVLRDTPRLRTVLFGPAAAAADDLVLHWALSVETKPGRPDLAVFQSQYQQHTEQEYLVLQVHPGAFGDDDFAEFQRIVSFLRSQQCTFLTAEQYRLLSTGAAL